MIRTPKKIVTALLLLGGLLTLFPVSIDATMPVNLTVLYSSDVLGEIEPCG